MLSDLSREEDHTGTFLSDMCDQREESLSTTGCPHPSWAAAGVCQSSPHGTEEEAVLGQQGHHCSQETKNVVFP